MKFLMLAMMLFAAIITANGCCCTAGCWKYCNIAGCNCDRCERGGSILLWYGGGFCGFVDSDGKAVDEKPCDRRKKRYVHGIDSQISGDPAIVFINIDVNRDGMITFEEFKKSETVLANVKTRNYTLEEGFIQMDTNGDQVIHPFELDSDLPR